MEHIGPLLQTLLWVALVGGIVARFHKPIDAILSALHKRIEEGSSVKAGPFELSDPLRPQDPLGQQQKAAEEVQEALQEEGFAGLMAREDASQRVADVQAKYFQAEDLVLRAIQVEYGATVKRHVTAGADMGFDGAFVTNGRLNIVEVKYAPSLRALSKIRESLERLATTVSKYRWGSVQIVLAVVFERPEDVGHGTRHLEGLTAGLSVPVAIRCFGLTDLQRRFEIADQLNRVGEAAG